MRFASPWDRKLRVITAASTLVLVAALGFVAAVIARTGLPGAIAAAVVAALGAGTVGFSWALAPRAFSLEHGALRIERPLRPVEIPLASIRAAALLGPGPLRGALRVAGSGGFFGYYGRFWSRPLGAFRLYATRTSDLVRVDTATERFLLSPERPERFLELLLSRAPASALSGGEPAPRRLARGTVVALVAALALVPVAIAAIVATAAALAR
jgi:hypothetical protein